MDTFLPRGGLHLPFQRRLSRLYNDTKKSSDFVVQAPISEDPEIKAMQRKLKIQKDRLVSWGLEWSDPSNQVAEIDESLSKAGLSDLVGSIMSTIKDILAEAEPLWLSSKRLFGSEKDPERPMGDRKLPLVVWDKGRFEDLIKDLTASIDTLYDLSRTRSSAAVERNIARFAKSSASIEDLRPFGSTRIQTPQEIDPKTLTNVKSLQGSPTSSEATAESRPQGLVLMSRQAYYDLTHRPGRQAWCPLLLEYGQFDPIYSTTGIMPSMARFEKLSAGLQTESRRSSGAWIGLPLLLGYFEDMENSRLGLVYQFPPSFNSLSFEDVTQNPVSNICNLAELLSRPDFEPRLEAKFRLAHNLANTIFDMHARGITHGDLRDTAISFGRSDSNTSGSKGGEVDIRKPIVSSFDLFPDDNPQFSSATTSLYRHSLDPRTTPESPFSTSNDTKTLDLYSLAMLLVSIGLWTKLENLVPDQTSPNVPESVLDQLAVQCGTLYMKAVQTCWNAVEEELVHPGAAEEIMNQVQLRASRYLEACCILDGISGLDERISEDFGEPSSVGRERGASLSSLPGPSTAKSPVAVQPWEQDITQEDLASAPSDTSSSGHPTAQEPATQDTHLVERSSPRLRLYPQIPLAPDVIDRWNQTVMPQVNSALHHFYRKHVESVEISLESIGESPQKTTPTILVVCTSVSKVRSILKRKLGALLGETGLALKVCAGAVFRSRNEDAPRSMAAGDEDELQAANPDFQQKPANGASIGAWIGDRHLPAVSLGGLVVVDDKTYGMTVHHMLDDQEEMQAHKMEGKHAARSSAAAQGEDFAAEFSDSESDVLDSALSSDAEEDDEDNQYADPGDIPGVEPGCGEGYIVTQPAFDDVPEGTYTNEETKNKDHLDAYTLGHVYASSGIRRRHDADGLVHEIDWALFEFQADRSPGDNYVPRVLEPGESNVSSSAAVHPTTVAPAHLLPGLQVQCMGRTSGLQTGQIMPALTTVKLYGRTTPSQSYEVSGKAAVASSAQDAPEGMVLGNMPQVPGLCLGMAGDSGAWIIERNNGAVCGHVLAWSKRKQVAYICPMEVLLRDVMETLEAREVRLPGGEPLLERQDVGGELAEIEAGLADLVADDDEEDIPQLSSAMRVIPKNLGRLHLRTGVFCA